MLWETGLSDIAEHTAKWCDYHNDTCYYAKNVPVIFSADQSTGYYTGGQNLSLTGHGFGSGSITVTVDGVDCPVTSYSERTLSCDIQASDVESVVGEPTQGSHGLRWRFINGHPDVNTDYAEYTAQTE
jgi:hypothetical protein